MSKYTIGAIKIGADPELFLRNIGGEMSFVSAHDVVPGTKAEPVPIPQGAIQADGTAAEFNVIPTGDTKEFVHNVETVLRGLTTIISKSRPGLRLVATPTATYEKGYWDALPEHAKEMGCEPDYQAWTNGTVNTKPNGEGLTFRTGGGHVHIGWTSGKDVTDISHLNTCIDMVKQLDAALFVPSLMWDKDKKRRLLYGKPGSFRPKEYGVEYRPLSNAWVGDPKLVAWVHATTVEAAKALLLDHTHLWEDKLLRDTLTDAREGVEIEDTELTNYCYQLCTHGFGMVPDEYINYSKVIKAL